MIDSTEVLFICPTYGHLDYAVDCVQSFKRHIDPSKGHALVIDDASDDWADAVFDCVQPISIIAHAERKGLTRAWNEGLTWAKAHGCTYAICGNSDLLFTTGWYEPLKEALIHAELVGPVSNAPGHATWQDIRQYASFTDTDSFTVLHEEAKQLRTHPIKLMGTKVINGFCMMAKTETWWDGAFDEHHVFDPSIPLAGNEVELQRRWQNSGKRIGFVPRSFVFHYRSVSRPEALNYKASRGLFRKTASTE